MLRDAGINVRGVQEITGFPEMLGGRVKTLHPAVHGGILALRDDPGHLEELARHDLKPIDLVASNLYPFLSVARDSGARLPLALENMERFGVPKHIVGFVVPTGYSFNLDGTTLYLSMASMFVAQAAAPGHPAAVADDRSLGPLHDHAGISSGDRSGSGSGSGSMSTTRPWLGLCRRATSPRSKTRDDSSIASATCRSRRTSRRRVPR